MKFAYGEMGHILSFGPGYAAELVVENRAMFRDLVRDISLQLDGMPGSVVLSIDDKPVEVSRHADMITHFSPFDINRKSLLSKLYALLEKQAQLPEYYAESNALVDRAELLIEHITEDLSVEVECKKLAVGPIIRAIGIEIAEDQKGDLEKIFDYMTLIRDLDRDRLFIMVNMRTFFSDDEMNLYLKTVCSHDFRLLLLENVAFPPLPNLKRYVVDEDLCEF